MDVSEIMQKIERSAGDDPETALMMMRRLSKQANTWAEERTTLRSYGKPGLIQPELPKSAISITRVDRETGWSPAFDALLGSLLNDVQLPVRACVIVEFDNVENKPLRNGYRGMVVGFTDEWVEFYDGLVVNRSEIVGIGL